LRALTGLVLIAGFVVGAHTSWPGHDPMYTVAQVQAGLARHPGSWVGHTVRVRGRATACSIELEHGHFHCLPRQPHLDDPDAGSWIEPLLLVWKDPNPALTIMRRVPLLGSLLPAPQELDWGTVATYRVQLRAVTRGPCSAATCYEALVLDAAP
jgi:hypothetical protein